MDQNRKPGVPPSKDISDLKARLGLKRPDGAAPGPGGLRTWHVPLAAAIPAGPAALRCPLRAGPGSRPRDRPQRPRRGPAPAGMNPYAR